MTPPKAPRTTNTRCHQLDLLRIFFAGLVLVSHGPEYLDGNRSREPLTVLTHSPVSFGAIAVYGFFLLSGFLILQSWDRKPEWRDFLQKRVLRIVPGYLVAVFFGTVAAGLLASGVPHFFHHLRLGFLLSVLELRDTRTPLTFPGLHFHSVNGALWTITYEFRCYLLVMFLGLLGILRNRRLWVGLTVLLAAANFLPWLRHLPASRLITLLFRVPTSFVELTSVFFVGGCFYLYRNEIPFRRSFALISAVILLLTAVFWPTVLAIPIVLCGGYLIFYLKSLQLTRLHWMDRVPDISYGLYLYGSTVELFLIWYHFTSPVAIVLLALLLGSGLGYLSWHLVERPMLRLKRGPAAALAPPGDWHLHAHKPQRAA